MNPKYWLLKFKTLNIVKYFGQPLSQNFIEYHNYMYIVLKF